MLTQGYGTWNSNMSMETGRKDIKTVAYVLRTTPRHPDRFRRAAIAMQVWA